MTTSDPTPTTPSKNPKNDLTARERELMAYAWLCFSEKPKPDYKKLAALAGMTNPASASNAWAKIQKKIQAQAGDVQALASGENTPEAQTPKKMTPKAQTPVAGKKRGRKPAAAKVADREGEDGDADEYGEKSPVNKSKTPKKVKEEPVEDGEDEDMF